jgi:hypothetical protein
MTDEQRLQMITDQLILVRDNLFRGMSKSIQKLQARSINEVLELQNFICSAPVLEPVAWRVRVETKLRDGSVDVGYQLRNGKLSKYDEPLYTTPPAQQPLMEPEGKCKECLTYNGHQDGCSHATTPAAQEPVGEVNRYGLDSHGRKWHGIHWYDPNVDVAHGTKLYTTPPAQPAPVQELQRYSPNGEGGMELDSLGAYIKLQDVAIPPAQPAPVTTERALDLALEALLINCGGNTEGVGKEAITAIKQALAAPVQELQRYSPNGEGGMELDSLGAYIKLQDVATPPAQPAVPDAFGTREGEHPQYIQGWNDCRAEMLKGMK